MFASSEEAPGEPGLGFFPGEVRALPTNVKSPHIGWNQLRRVRESALLREIPGDAYFYFAHSYAAPASAAATVAACDHGFPFAAVIEQGNLRAVQFHPEKSGETGARVLRNFLESVQ
jgi:glutamine amidotransferase